MRSTPSGLSFRALLRGGAQLKGARQRGGGAQPEGERRKLSLVDSAETRDALQRPLLPHSAQRRRTAEGGKAEGRRRTARGGEEDVVARGWRGVGGLETLEKVS
jgi:hypothetical protein